MTDLNEALIDFAAQIALRDRALARLCANAANLRPVPYEMREALRKQIDGSWGLTIEGAAVVAVLERARA